MNVARFVIYVCDVTQTDFELTYSSSKFIKITFDHEMDFTNISIMSKLANEYISYNLMINQWSKWAANTPKCILESKGLDNVETYFVH